MRAGINKEVGTITDLSNEDKAKVEAFYQDTKEVSVTHSDNVTTITYPDNTWYESFKNVCQLIEVSISVFRGQKVR
jgi:hypothetical protein